MLRVQESPGKGRGVFAQRAFQSGETIERAPVLVISPQDWEHIEQTNLHNYCFDFDEQRLDQVAALVLGHGSLYNHSYRPNARYFKRFAERAVDFVALRDIADGEEITINYNGDPDDRTAVWFEVSE